MPRLRPRREGKHLLTNGKLIPFSFWPARRSKRWALQRRLYVKDPWATLFEAVYRSDIAQNRIDEALSYLDQAEAYFNAGTQIGGRVSVKPLLLYYSVLNLSKCLIAVRKPSIDLSHARHGLTATRQYKRAILGDEIGIKTAASAVNIFSELMQLLDGSSPSLKNLEVRHLLPQILPGHLLWTYACRRKEQFINVEIVSYHDPSTCDAWLNVWVDRGELAYLGKSVRELITDSELPGHWDQVQGTSAWVFIQQSTALRYKGRPLDRVDELFRSVRPALWSVVTGTYPYRKYYLNCDSGLGVHRLPQWASVYVLFCYLSDLTRYRPVHFDRFLEGKYGPQIESILDECPRQFLFLMASELLQREVASADLA
jgi:YaaC-like Protein